jgi:DnaJ-class molecular chaperone
MSADRNVPRKVYIDSYGFRRVTCPDCGGDGRYVDYDAHDRGLSNGAPVTCTKCRGHGLVSACGCDD